MNYVQVWSYDNYVPAHLDMGRLQEEGFDCWLKDENMVTIDPLLTNAIGGIKLMVSEQDAEKAWQLLNQLRVDYKKTISCPICNSHNLELVSTPRKASNWITALGFYSLFNFPLTVEKVYHCFDCKHEFDLPPDNS